MELSILTIEQFRLRSLRSGLYYRNNLIVTNRVDVELFKSPCRIDAITILVCISGEIDCSINLKPYHIGADMILVNFPNDIIQIHSAKSYDAYAVLISSDFLNELEINFKHHSDFYLNIRKKAVCQLPHTEIVTLKPYYILLSNGIERLRAESPEVIRGLVRAFSYTVISLMNAFRQQEEVEGNDGMDRNKQLFNKFMALLKLYYAYAHGVQCYADKLCLTPQYLSSAVRKYTGKTATTWINEYVILKAKIMLKDSDLSISDIAYRLNFSSLSDFGRYFKLQTGMRPKVYRNNG